MHLFDCSPEVVEHIFEAIASSRDLKRFMRLRLVNRQFKYFVDDAIFRLRLLDFADMYWRGTSLNEWSAYALEYLVYQAWVEKDPKSLRGRIRRAAVIMSEQVGETEQTSIKARLRSLCHLALHNKYWSSTQTPFYSETLSSSSGCYEEELEADLCVAAVYLGHLSYVESLISKGYRLWNHHQIADELSGVFGGAYRAAVLKGDLSMIRLLISSEPSCDQPPLPDSELYRWVAGRAARFGYKDVFDFACDCGHIGLPQREGVHNHRDLEYKNLKEYHFVREMIADTPHPDIYKRGASMPIPKGELFIPRRLTLLRLLGEKARAGHVDMVRYLLNQTPWPNQEDVADGLTSIWDPYKLLIDAAEGGNPEIIKLLLHHGANPNWSPDVDTALMAATRHSGLTIAKILLDAGAEVNVGCPPPIVLAVFKEDMDMFHLLRRYGAKLNTPETGNWAMAVAYLYELESMVDVLIQEGVERGVVLYRCPARGEKYHHGYLFP
ncbi:ankyrin repeat-containing domain protein [Annulohypoxylon moriforme]|nr:ankyrin repeat-containing domain protein [Annulohypoxylon moriforme]